MSHAIHQEISIAAAPERVFKLLTEGDEFTAVSGAPATIAPTEGTPFSCFGGVIVGRNIELVPGRRLVQAWRVKTWDPGLYSIARFELSPQDAGTLIAFDHTGFPPGEHDHLASGWHANYWDRLQAYVG